MRGAEATSTIACRAKDEGNVRELGTLDGTAANQGELVELEAPQAMVVGL